MGDDDNPNDDRWFRFGGLRGDPRGASDKPAITGTTLEDEWDEIDEDEPPAESDLEYDGHDILERTHNYATNNEVLHEGGSRHETDEWISADMDTFVYDVTGSR